MTEKDFSSHLNKDLNIAGKLSSIFIEHPLTFILGVFILILGYISLIIMPREENPQIKVSGGAVIVVMPGASPSEIQKIIIEPLEKKIQYKVSVIAVMLSFVVNAIPFIIQLLK